MKDNINKYHLCDISAKINKFNIKSSREDFTWRDIQIEARIFFLQSGKLHSVQRDIEDSAKDL